MQDLRTLEVDQLADLLSEELSRYYTLGKDKKYINETIKCQLMIHEIQKEIDSRKKKLSR